MKTPRRVSISSWTLHALLGTVAAGRPGEPDARLMAPHQPAQPLDLLDLPDALAARGVHTMELCHFHLPRRDAEYFKSFRARLAKANVELWSLLIDDGDVNHAEHGDRDREWIAGWIRSASELGAKRTRVIAGKQEPTESNRARSATQLKILAKLSDTLGVRLMTENWFATLSKPEYVRALLDETRVGLNLDFGNWSGPGKYADFATIAKYAESCHAKCNFVNGQPDREDYTRCLQVTRDADYSGPYTIVYGDPSDVWGSVEKQREIIAPYI